MKNKINTWGRLAQKSQVQNYENGGLAETLGGIAGIAGPIGSLIGTGFSLVSNLVGAKRQREEAEKQRLIQQQAQTQSNLLAMPQSGGGMPGALAMGGYLTSELLAKAGMRIKSYEKGGYTDPPEKGLNTISSPFTVSNKTQWIPQSAALSKYKQLMANKDTKGAEDLVFGYYANEPYGPYDPSTHGEYESKGKIKAIRARDLIDLDTKKYKAPKDYDALIDVIKPKVIDRNPGQQFQNVTLKMANGGYANPLGTDYTSLVNYNSGGMHSQNPLGGIPLGQSPVGKQNTVEEGETSFKFNEGKYIFSNRLKLKR